MTLHIVLPTEKGDELVWVTETKAFMGLGNTSEVEKIKYVQQGEVACSSWGDFIGVNIRDIFADRVKAGDLPDRSEENTIALLMDSASILKSRPPGPPGSRGVIIATFKPLRIYQASVNEWPPAILPVTGSIVAGDEFNAASLFPTYYYELSGKSLEECLIIGIHGMRIARKLKSQALGYPNVWLYSKEKFRHLSKHELAQPSQLRRVSD